MYKNYLKVSRKTIIFNRFNLFRCVIEQFETQIHNAVTHHNVNKIRINDTLTTRENILFWHYTINIITTRLFLLGNIKKAEVSKKFQLYETVDKDEVDCIDKIINYEAKIVEIAE